MKTRKHLALCILLVLVILMTSCKRGPKGIDRPTEFDFRTGSQGLIVTYPTGLSRELFENDPDVRMIVEIRNRGAFPQREDIDKFFPHIWVSGFDNNILDLRFRDGVRLDRNVLEGKTAFNPEGGFASAILEGSTYSLPEGTTAYRPNVIVSVSYNYETVASPIACIDPNPRSTDVREKTCRVESYRSLSMGGSQGGPVAVTKVEEDVTSNAILFRIFVQNVGDGLVIRRDLINRDPSAGYDFDKLDYVRVADVSAGNRQLICTPGIGQEVKLIDKKAFIFCKLPTAGIENVFTSPLNIKLDYGYLSSAQQQIAIFKEILV